MFVKILNRAGIAACIVLIVSCFVPWVHYADIDQTFTGFYSFKNQYGKPGKFLVGAGVIVLTCMLVPKVMAKRINLFLSALTLAYAVKTYILITSCYNNYCPEKLPGIYIMLIAAALMMVAAVFPNMKLETNEKIGK